MKSILINILLPCLFLGTNAFDVEETITFNDNAPTDDVTAFRAHPWNGLIEYRKDDEEETTFGCSATLISARHALVAAHCVTGAVIERIGKPESVLFGEYDMDNDEPDCVTFDDYVECMDEPLSVDIEKIVVHPSYRSGISRDDIAVIHFDEDIATSEFISPISLPPVDITETLEDGNFKFSAAGWGSVVSGLQTNTKNLIEKPYVEFGRCRKFFQELIASPIDWGNHICAGGDDQNSFCQEDSGGALVRKVYNNYYVDGISSFAIIPCTFKAPVVYTKVYSYSEWIVNELTSLN